MERHPFDAFSFVSGALVLGGALLLLTGGLGDVSLRWVGPVAVIALGALMIVASWSGRSKPSADAEDAEVQR